MMYVDARVLEQFRAAMSRRGLVAPRTGIRADGKIHRCNTKDKRGRGDGSYLLHADGVVPAGGFCNFKDGVGWKNWKYDTGRDFTAAEQREYEEKIAAAAKV